LAQTSGGPGTTDQVQLGLGLALPINPGAGFGSILASADVAVDEKIALRTDVGFESVGFNGNNSAGTSHTSRYFAGVARLSRSRSAPPSPSSRDVPVPSSSAISTTSATAGPGSTRAPAD